MNTLGDLRDLVESLVRKYGDSSPCSWLLMTPAIVEGYVTLARDPRYPGLLNPGRLSQQPYFDYAEAVRIVELWGEDENVNGLAMLDYLKENYAAYERK